MNIPTYEFHLVEQNRTILFNVEEPSPVFFKADPRIQIIVAERYQGPYEATPSDQTQILRTADMTMTNDVVVNPIPSNYGLITWNGSTITVS